MSVGGPRLEPPAGGVGFLGAPVHTDAATVDADLAVLGVPFGVPYDMRGVASGASEAPEAVRASAARLAPFLDHHDFDVGGPLLGDPPLRLVDCGDVPGNPRDLDDNAARATEAVRAVLDRGAVPIVLGGDDSVPILVLRAYARHGPVHVVQIDAHLDFRDEVRSVREGYSSPMRRASEMDHVARVVHVGQRGVGASRPQDVADTLAAGNAIVTAREVREAGPKAVLRHLPEGSASFVTLDCDGLDPAVMPGTSAPMPGGLSFDEAAGILGGLAPRCRVVGMDVVEHYPSLDVNGITSLAVVRLIANLVGGMARAPGRNLTPPWHP